MTVTDDSSQVKLYTAAEILDVVLAAYARGRADGAAQAARDRWNSPAVASAFRQARVAAEVAWMRRRAAGRYDIRGYPTGYDYKGGPVDWETGMPAGSACAWLRRTRTAVRRSAA